MHLIDPNATLFAALVVTLLTTLGLLLLPTSLARDRGALYTWAAGNACLMVTQAVTLFAPLMPASVMPWVVSASHSGIVLGAGLHSVAVARLLGVVTQVATVRMAWLSAATHLVLTGLWGLPPLAATGIIVFTTAWSIHRMVMCWPWLRVLRGAAVMTAGLGAMVLMLVAGFLQLISAPDQLLSHELPIRPLPLLALEMLLAVTINLAFFMLVIEQLTLRLERLSVTDPLTELSNRRGFLQAAQGLIQQQSRVAPHQRGAAVLLMDLDHFKQVNDRLGHKVGDEVLRSTARRLRESLRQTDVLGRWGGEEFVALLPACPAACAAEAAQRLRQRLAEEPVPEGLPRVTISIGVATLPELPTEAALDALIAQADGRLYAAKRHRNCVVGEEAAVAV